MNNILIVSGHPQLSHSTANRTIIEELISYPKVTVVDIRANYPGYAFDIEREQENLLRADLIILQSPIIWYGIPSHVKAWIESVFTFGFAFGPGGTKLQGKDFLVSVTAGSSKEEYTTIGKQRYPMETFLHPIEVFTRYCGMNYLPPVISYGMSSNSNNGSKEIAEKARLHSEKIKKVLESYIGIEDRPSRKHIFQKV